ncbi:hypothetical protein WICPIJ_009697 [Wickerhamomyces pijperi]|uniref:FHA domain-containing protein n=1 Tax=Wickerhamomyces pijperi TaxID=599730 RepID=A0A9P8TCQ6_WICPI|nr:hypothetical protein WICPIJ_009697 [Wickerhamomyces pijperi]
MSNILQLPDLSRQATLENNSSTAAAAAANNNNTLDLPVTLDDKPKTRSRSNSKVYGRSSSLTQPLLHPPPPLPQAMIQNSKNTETSPQTQQPMNLPSIPPQISISNTNGTLGAFSNGSEVPPSHLAKIPNRSKVIFLVIATSLNETFEKKTLTVPEFPSVLKLGRPNSSQKAPNGTNGYFDSRVISREHAELYVKDGRVYIKDCNSSNGTFVNDEKLSTEMELRMEDVVNLGVDIDNDKNKHQHHRKISLFIENVLTVPIEEGIDPTSLIQDVIKKSERSIRGRDRSLNTLDAALFGDINDDIQELTAGLEQEVVSGVFLNNSNTNTNTALAQTLKTLVTQIHMENLNNLKLASIESFLLSYKEQIAKNDQLSNLSKAKKESEIAKLRAQELFNEVQSLKRALEEKESQIHKTHEIISNRELEIDGLRKSVSLKERQTKEEKNKSSVLIVNHEEEIQLLKSKINDQSTLVEELIPFKNKYNEAKIRYELNHDIFNMVVVVFLVVAAGYTTLWYH